MTELCCDVCGSRDSEPELVVNDYFSLESFDLVRCRDCGLVYVNPLPSAEALGQYYPEGVYERGQFSSLGLWLRKRRLDRYLGNASPGTALDIGCGDGKELLYLREKGWQVVGTELSESSCAAARSAGLEVHCEELEIIGFPDESFDVVMMWHVIEHLRSPRQALQDVNRILKPDGTLLLGCPNYNSVDVWLAKANAYLDVPRHLYHFTESTMRRLLADTGFDVVATHWFSLEIGVVSTLQSLLNVLPFTRTTPSFLLDWMGAGLYKQRMGRACRRHLLAHMLLTAPIGLVCVPLVAWAALARFSPTMELSSRRRTV